MINYSEYERQSLIENPKMTKGNIKRSYDFECELEQFDHVVKTKFKPWGKRKLMILISNNLI